MRSASEGKANEIRGELWFSTNPQGQRRNMYVTVSIPARKITIQNSRAQRVAVYENRFRSLSVTSLFTHDIHGTSRMVGFNGKWYYFIIEVVKETAEKPETLVFSTNKLAEFKRWEAFFKEPVQTIPESKLQVTSTSPLCDVTPPAQKISHIAATPVEKLQEFEDCKKEIRELREAKGLPACVDRDPPSAAARNDYSKSEERLIWVQKRLDTLASEIRRVRSLSPERLHLFHAFVELDNAEAATRRQIVAAWVRTAAASGNLMADVLARCKSTNSPNMDDQIGKAQRSLEANSQAMLSPGSFGSPSSSVSREAAVTPRVCRSGSVRNPSPLSYTFSTFRSPSPVVAVGKAERLAKTSLSSGPERDQASISLTRDIAVCDEFLQRDILLEAAERRLASRAKTASACSITPRCGPRVAMLNANDSSLDVAPAHAMPWVVTCSSPLPVYAKPISKDRSVDDGSSLLTHVRRGDVVTVASFEKGVAQVSVPVLGTVTISSKRMEPKSSKLDGTALFAQQVADFAKGAQKRSTKARKEKDCQRAEIVISAPLSLVLANGKSHLLSSGTAVEVENAACDAEDLGGSRLVRVATWTTGYVSTTAGKRRKEATMAPILGDGYVVTSPEGAAVYREPPAGKADESSIISRIPFGTAVYISELCLGGAVAHVVSPVTGFARLENGEAVALEKSSSQRQGWLEQQYHQQLALQRLQQEETATQGAAFADSLQKKQVQIAALQQELQNLGADQKKAIGELETVLALKEAEAESLRNQVRQTEALLQAHAESRTDEALAATTEKLHVAQRENDSLKEQLATEKRAAKEQASVMLGLNEELLLTCEEAARVSIERSHSEKEVSQLREAAATVAVDLKNAHQMIEELKAVLEREHKAADSRAAALDQLQKDKTDHELTLSNLRSTLLGTQHEKTHLQEMAVVQEQRIAHLDSELVLTNKEIRSLGQQNSQKMQLIDSLHQELSSSGQALLLKSEELQRLEHDLSEQALKAMHNLSAAQKKVDASDIKVQTLESELELARSSNDSDLKRNADTTIARLNQKLCIASIQLELKASEDAIMLEEVLQRMKLTGKAHKSRLEALKKDQMGRIQALNSELVHKIEAEVVLRMQINTLEVKVERQTSEVSDLRHVLKAKERDLDDAAQREQEAQHQLMVAMRDLRSRSEHLEVHAQKLGEQAQVAVAKQSAELESAHAKVATLQSLQSQADEESHRSSARIRELQSEREALAERFESSLRDLADLRQVHSTLLESREEEREEARQASLFCQQQVEDARLKCAELEAALQTEKDATAAPSYEVKQHCSLHEDYERDVRGMTEELEVIERRAVIIRRESEAAVNELRHELNDKITRLTAVVDEAEANRGRLSREVNVKDDIINRLRDENTCHQSLASALRSQMDECTSKATRVKEQLRIKSTEALQNKTDAAGNEEITSKLKKQVVDAEHSLEQQTKVVASLRKKSDSLASVLELTQQELRDKSELSEKLQTTIATLSSESESRLKEHLASRETMVQMSKKAREYQQKSAKLRECEHSSLCNAKVQLSRKDERMQSLESGLRDSRWELILLKELLNDKKEELSVQAILSSDLRRQLLKHRQATANAEASVRTLTLKVETMNHALQEKDAQHTEIIGRLAKSEVETAVVNALKHQLVNLELKIKCQVQCAREREVLLEKSLRDKDEEIRRLEEWSAQQACETAQAAEKMWTKPLRTLSSNEAVQSARRKKKIQELTKRVEIAEGLEWKLRSEKSDLQNLLLEERCRSDAHTRFDDELPSHQPCRDSAETEQQSNAHNRSLSLSSTSSWSSGETAIAAASLRTRAADIEKKWNTSRTHSAKSASREVRANSTTFRLLNRSRSAPADVIKMRTRGRVLANSKLSNKPHLQVPPSTLK
ncbi:hypothetical protein DIPPA_00995 [Diplonema papillatum]|nr:hypothetical protein DIPPA_00995 [Diplonema papillatum]